MVIYGLKSRCEAKVRRFPIPLQGGMPCDDGRARGPPLPDEGARIKQEGLLLEGARAEALGEKGLGSPGL